MKGKKKSKTLTLKTKIEWQMWNSIIKNAVLFYDVLTTTLCWLYLDKMSGRWAFGRGRDDMMIQNQTKQQNKVNRDVQIKKEKL